MSEVEQIIADLTAAKCTVALCGSKVTCDPPPVGTDTDYRVSVPKDERVVASVVDILGSAGFQWESGEHYQNAAADGFMSWRKDDVNFIVSSNSEWLRRHVAATALSKRLNLLSKSDRIALFQAVLYGNIEP
jgi:hypothetical protein